MPLNSYGYQFVKRAQTAEIADAAVPSFAANLPPSVNLRDKCTPVRDQGSLGACTGFALCACLELGGEIVLSPLFVYFCERVREGSVSTDSGALIVTGSLVVAQTGACTEPVWPYIISKFAQTPPQEAYEDAASHRSPKCTSLPVNLDVIKAQLAAGVPVVVGISAYASFESFSVQQTGVVPMPDVLSEDFLGGHAVAIVGYDDTTSLFLAKNSWGTGWGDEGYLHIPYAYILSDELTSEIFAITPLGAAVIDPSSPPPSAQPTQPSYWSQMTSTQQGLFIAALVLVGIILVIALVMVGLSASQYSKSLR